MKWPDSNNAGIDRQRWCWTGIRSSSGRELLSPEGVARLLSELLAHVGWITPNLDELAVLTEEGPISLAGVPAAAARLQELARKAGNPKLSVVATGGHHDRPDDFLLTCGGKGTWFEGKRVETESTHGTGCAFSSALLCQLVQGASPQQAVAGAKEYVTAALKVAYPVGRGRGPMHHLFNRQPAV